MNDRKVGQPYLYPESLFSFASSLWAKSFDLRTLEGVLRGLSWHTSHWPGAVLAKCAGACAMP